MRESFDVYKNPTFVNQQRFSLLLKGETMAYKKCTFPKLGTKKHQLKNKNKKSKALSPNERSKALNRWKDGWFESN